MGVIVPQEHLRLLQAGCCLSRCLRGFRAEAAKNWSSAQRSTSKGQRTPPVPQAAESGSGQQRPSLPSYCPAAPTAVQAAASVRRHRLLCHLCRCHRRSGLLRLPCFAFSTSWHLAPSSPAPPSPPQTPSLPTPNRRRSRWRRAAVPSLLQKRAHCSRHRRQTGAASQPRPSGKARSLQPPRKAVHAPQLMRCRGAAARPRCGGGGRPASAIPPFEPAPAPSLYCFALWPAGMAIPFYAVAFRPQADGRPVHRSRVCACCISICVRVARGRVGAGPRCARGATGFSGAHDRRYGVGMSCVGSAYRRT